MTLRVVFPASVSIPLLTVESSLFPRFILLREGFLQLFWREVYDRRILFRGRYGMCISLFSHARCTAISSQDMAVFPFDQVLGEMIRA